MLAKQNFGEGMEERYKQFRIQPRTQPSEVSSSRPTHSPLQPSSPPPPPPPTPQPEVQAPAPVQSQSPAPTPMSAPSMEPVKPVVSPFEPVNLSTPAAEAPTVLGPPIPPAKPFNQPEIEPPDSASEALLPPGIPSKVSQPSTDHHKRSVIILLGIVVLVAVAAALAVSLLPADKKAKAPQAPSRAVVKVDSVKAKELFNAMLADNLSVKSVTKKEVIQTGSTTSTTVGSLQLADFKAVRSVWTSTTQLNQSADKTTFQVVSVPEGIYANFQQKPSAQPAAIGQWFTVSDAKGKIDKTGSSLIPLTTDQILSAKYGPVVFGSFDATIKNQLLAQWESSPPFTYDEQAVLQKVDDDGTYDVFPITFNAVALLAYNQKVASFNGQTLTKETNAALQSTAKYTKAELWVDTGTTHVRKLIYYDPGGAKVEIEYYNFNQDGEIIKPSAIVTADSLKSQL